MAQGNSGTGYVDEFAANAETYGVTVSTHAPEEVESALASCIEAPAVGTPLPFGGISLPETVQTDPTPAQLRDATTGVTPASLAIASYGTLVLRADEHGSEPVSLFNDLHVAVVQAVDIVPDMSTAFEYLGEEIRESRDSAILATGPSATADMGSLVQGAHGPKRVEVLVVR